jgi:hypothetical protein
VASRIWVAELRWSRATAEKLSQVHGLQVTEVEDAIVCREGLRAGWTRSPERGLRAMIQIQIRHKPVLVVLYPVGQDCFNLGSAYPIGKGSRR